jgi:hypothetical protein
MVMNEKALPIFQDRRIIFHDAAYNENSAGIWHMKEIDDGARVSQF